MTADKLFRAIRVAFNRLIALAEGSVLWFNVSMQIDWIDVFARTSYFVIAAMFFWSIWVFCRMALIEKFDWRQFLRDWRVDALAGVLVTALVLITLPPEWRTLSDETNLLSVSQSMINEKTVFNVTMAKSYFDLFNPVMVGLPTRPLFFPFLVHLVHAVVGFKPENAFVLNAILFFGLSVGIFGVVRRRLGLTVAISTMLTVISYPIITLYATSGGFDLCSAFFFMAAFACLYRFLMSPSADRYWALTATLILFSHIRYESVLIFALVQGMLFLFGYLKSEYFFGSKRSLDSGLALVFLSPLVLQRLLTQGQYENPDGGAPVQIDYFPKYFSIFASNIFKGSFYLPYVPWVNAFAMIAFLMLSRRVFGKRGAEFSKPFRLFSVIFSVCFLASMAVFLSHHFGDYTHPTQARFFLLFSLICALTPAAVIEFGVMKWLTPNRFFVASVIIAMLYFPVASRDRFLKTLTLNRETRVYLKFLEAHPESNNLFVYERPGQMAATGKGSVDFSYANQNRETLLNELSRRLFKDIYIFQHVRLSNGELQSDNKLDAGFRLEMLEETQVQEDTKFRISKVARN